MFFWLKKYPLTIFLLLSLTIHLLALGGSRIFGWRKSPPSRSVIEFDYYQIKVKAEDKVEVSPLPPEEERVEMEKQLRHEIAELEAPPLPALLPPVVDVPEEKSKADEVFERVAPSPSPSRAEIIEEYVNLLKERIEAQIQYPDLALKMAVEGSVVVSFTLNRKGDLNTLFIPEEGASSFFLFNQEALRAVRKASRRFPSFPESLPDVKLTFRLPVSFILK